MKSLNNLEEFKNSFFQLLNQPLSFDEFLRKLKEEYWLPGKGWLADAIPWKELKEYHLKPINIHMISDSMGLLTASFEIAPKTVISFSLLKKDNRWFMDWQNREVWLSATKEWNKKTEGNLEVRFFEAFQQEDIDFLFKELHLINQWIHKEFGFDQENLVMVFGYDSLEYLISQTGHRPSSGGGNSRGRLILMCETFPNLRSKTIESVYFESILLHEMIHEYSCYDKLWKGSIFNPSLKLMLINEGVATYYQFKFFMEKIKNMQIKDDEPVFAKIKSGIEEALNYKEQVLEVLSNPIFAEVNRKNPKAYNPAYFLGASLYGYLLHKLGFENARRICAEAANMEAKKAEDFLAHYFNKEEYLSYSRDYFDEILNNFTQDN